MLARRLVGWVILFSASTAAGQSPPPPPVGAGGGGRPPWQQSPEERERQQQQTRDDHADMMAKLGISRLRPGPSGSTAPGTPNPANYDPAKANPFPDWPELLKLNDGALISTADDWWQRRRPEIVQLLETEVVGRIPITVPKVNWKVTEKVKTLVGGLPVNAFRVVGNLDNASHPAVSVEIQMAVVLPIDARGPVPVLIMFGSGGMPGEGGARPFGPSASEPGAPPSTDQLIAAGWGYVSLNPGSIQADHGAGLTAGIIGLTNRGARRQPEDWGALRAWGWGASRALDFLESLPEVDARRVGIEGVSRYGKAALVTMAFDQRFGLALIGSSGEGGVKPHRRHFGEAVESLTGSGQYHWMAGAFLKYGADQSTFGSRNAGDIPVDSHQLLALCAPRLTFISYGIPEKGDAHWLDQHGSFMATVAAGPAWRLLGARDLGVTGDYRSVALPAVNQGLLDGELAWRQHDGGHEDRTNMSAFLEWANRRIRHQPPTRPADSSVMRHDRNSHLAHAQLVEKAKKGGIDLYFLGDSITRRWGATDYPDFLAHWSQSFHGWNAGNFGWGGDTTQNILWRLDNGELDGVHPKVIVLLAGTNNLSRPPAEEPTIAEITRGVAAIVARCRQKAPSAHLLLIGILPRQDHPGLAPSIQAINKGLSRLADGERVRFLDVGAALTRSDGSFHDGVSPDGLHLNTAGYQRWAEAMEPHLAALLGPRAESDTAPPATGDPSAAEPKQQ